MKNLLIKTSKTIKNALKQLSKSGEKCLVVIDDKQKFLGTLSDGDVRKAILSGKKFDVVIGTIFNDNYGGIICFQNDDVSILNKESLCTRLKNHSKKKRKNHSDRNKTLH